MYLSLESSVVALPQAPRQSIRLYRIVTQWYLAVNPTAQPGLVHSQRSLSALSSNVQINKTKQYMATDTSKINNVTPNLNVEDNRCRKVSCFYTKADQFVNKFTEFHTRISISNADIIAITEVKQKNPRYSYLLSEISLNHCNRFPLSLDNTIGRGIIIYIKNCLNAQLVPIYPE